MHAVVLPAAKGRIIVLNGASSAGKSSIARGLQAVLPTPHLHVQLDAFRAMEPEGYFMRGQPDVSALRVAALCRAINAAAREYANHGQDVLLDHVLLPQAWQFLDEDLAGLPVLRIGVHCSIETLRKREAMRQDRTAGLAESQVPLVHAGVRYDFEVDTTDRETSACVQLIADWLLRS